MKNCMNIAKPAYPYTVPCVQNISTTMIPIPIRNSPHPSYYIRESPFPDCDYQCYDDYYNDYCYGYWRDDWCDDCCNDYYPRKGRCCVQTPYIQHNYLHPGFRRPICKRFT